MGGRVKVPYREWALDCSAAIAKYLPPGTTPSRTALPGDEAGGDVIIDYVEVTPPIAEPKAPSPEPEKPPKNEGKEARKPVNTEEYLKSKRRGHG